MSDLIEAHLRFMKAAGMRQATTVRARSELLYRLERDLPMGLDRATVEELEAFLADATFSGETRATYYTHIVGYFRWACDPSRTHLDYDPSAGLRRPARPKGVPKPVTDAELRHALATLDEPWLAYIRLAAYAGARVGEIAILRKEDITEERMRILGKGGKTRVLKTHPEVWASVRHFPAGRLAQRKNRPPDPAYISSRCIYRLKRIGLVGITMHQFRHWYATTMLKPKEFGGGGASLRCVQENLGHDTPATTARYTLVSDEERDAGIDALPTFTTQIPS